MLHNIENHLLLLAKITSLLAKLLTELPLHGKVLKKHFMDFHIQAIEVVFRQFVRGRIYIC